MEHPLHGHKVELSKQCELLNGTPWQTNPSHPDSLEQESVAQHGPHAALLAPCSIPHPCCSEATVQTCGQSCMAESTHVLAACCHFSTHAHARAHTHTHTHTHTAQLQQT